MAKKSMKMTPQQWENVVLQAGLGIADRGCYYDNATETFYYDNSVADRVEAADKDRVSVSRSATIKPNQLRKALRQMNLRTAFDAWLEAQDDDVKDDIEYDPMIRRDSPHIAAAAAELNWTSAQVDDLFRLAATL